MKEKENPQMENKKRRIFLGIPLSDSARRELKLHLKKLPGKIVPSANWHITMHFLGNQDEENIQLIHKLLSELILGKPIEIIIQPLGAFPVPKKGRILWAGLSQGKEELITLYDNITDLLLDADFRLEDRPYEPHITLSRVQPPKNLSHYLDNYHLPKIPMTVTEIILYESHLEPGHPRYQELFKFKFES